jgi:hypothetical protein
VIAICGTVNLDTCAPEIYCRWLWQVGKLHDNLSKSNAANIRDIWSGFTKIYYHFPWSDNWKKASKMCGSRCIKLWVQNRFLHWARNSRESKILQSNSWKPFRQTQFLSNHISEWKRTTTISFIILSSHSNSSQMWHFDSKFHLAVRSNTSAFAYSWNPTIVMTSLKCGAKIDSSQM